MTCLALSSYFQRMVRLRVKMRCVVLCVESLVFETTSCCRANDCVLNQWCQQVVVPFRQQRLLNERGLIVRVCVRVCVCKQVGQVQYAARVCTHIYKIYIHVSSV